ncbi:MAG: polysaccharide lyase [Spirochaetota bacterium]
MLLFAIACMRTPVYEPTARTASRTFDFETGTFAGIYTNETPRPSAAQIVSSPALGSYAAKITVAPEDVVANGNRSELAIYDCAPYGATVFFRFCFYIPVGDPDGFQWQIIAQLYQLPDFQHGETFDYWYPHPPVTAVYVPGYLEIHMNVGSELVVARTPITKGVWYTNVMEIYFRDDASGYVEVLVNGTPITPANGGNHRYYRATLHNKAGCYFKTGLYRGTPGASATQARSTNTIYIDDIRIGSTLAEVYP